MITSSKVRKVAFVGDYIPRKCGIATFTADVFKAVTGYREDMHGIVISVNDTEEGYDYPEEVRFEIPEKDITSYQRAADFLNINNVDVVCLQHEFGIYGGPAGSHILALLRELRIAVVTTLHTVLHNPNQEQRRVMQELIRHSTRLVVMTPTGEKFLREIYNAPESKIDLIPHGIPDMPFVDPNFYKDQFGVEGKLVILTFGLLSPSKGIEYALRALAKVVVKHPNVVYIILGATHPHLLREQGETYRISLERLAKDLKIEKNVIFYNRYVTLEELKEFIAAADIYITPYLNEDQITSGTLSYAFGAGKATISTPYWHARDLLSDHRGILVPFRDSDAIADAIIELIEDEPKRHAIRKNAYLSAREMVWQHVGHLYIKSFEKARRSRYDSDKKIFATKTLDKQVVELPKIRLDHLRTMTDSTGILQHARFNVPNFSEGYCTDDNARAFIFSIMLEELGEETKIAKQLSSVYLAFLLYAFNEENKRFRNFMGFNRQWLEEMGSEDSHGRALWALGYCLGRSSSQPYQLLAGQLFEQAIGVVPDFTSPRAWAFVLIGIHEYFRRFSGDRLVNNIRDILTDKLMGLYKANSSKEWRWIEDIVSYDNAKIPHALILSGRWTRRNDVLEAGLDSLRWLVSKQTTEQGYFRPIGSNGFYQRNSNKRAYFDQQPVEAASMTSACIEAYRTTLDDFWLQSARRSLDWFLGKNDLGIPLYDPNTGGCKDALHIDRVNQNQGAESTLSFLLALAEMKLLQNMLVSYQEPPHSESDGQEVYTEETSEPSKT